MRSFINDFLKDIKVIWADGKRLYKISNKTKLKIVSYVPFDAKVKLNKKYPLLMFFYPFWY